jgi:hypothetical protein
MTNVHRSRAILRLKRKSTASVLGKAYAVLHGMGADVTRFSTPTPPLGTLKDQVAKVEVAEHLVGTRVKGAAAARNVQREILIRMLETECFYVQTLCNASPDQAVAIIEAAGLSVATTPVRNQATLKVTRGIPSGTVELDANATALAGRSGKKTCFNWQWTPDGGTTFTSVPTTPHAKTTIANLPPLTRVGFRVSTTTIKGPAEWSQIVTTLVH